MKAFLDPDAEWHVALAPILDGFRAEVLEVREAGDDAVIVEVRFVAKGRASGASIEQPFFHVYRFRDGKAISLHSYGSREQGLEAVWLRE
jgi:ketosteroid isomerase-like protein